MRRSDYQKQRSDYQMIRSEYQTLRSESQSLSIHYQRPISDYHHVCSDIRGAMKAQGRLKSPPQKIIREYRLHVQTERW